MTSEATTPARNSPRRQSFAWLREHLGVVCAAAVFVYCAIHAFDPPRLNWGDPGSDYNVMTAGRNFQRYGFLKLHLTPHLLDAASMTPADRVLIYTHYPQLPDLVNGVERTVFGMSELAQFRLVALCFSFGALFFVYALVAGYWSKPTAECALALWVVNPLWIQHADYLHHAPLAFFFGAGCVYFLTRHLRAKGRPTRYAVLAGVFLFLAFLSSYDFWFLVPLLLAAVTIAHHRGVNLAGLRLLATLGLCAVAAILFKWGTNAWALGGIHGWLADLRYQVTERSTNDAVKTAYESGIAPTAFGRIERYFSILFLVVTAAWLVAALWRRRVEHTLKVALPSANPLVILAATLPFLCLFTELWVEQVYPTLLLIPFYSIACGALVVVLVGARARALAIVGVGLFVALMANSLDEDVTFKKAFFEPSAIASLKTELDSVSAPGQHILVNHVFDGAYRYYFNRFTIALIATPPSRMSSALAYYAEPGRAPSATARGAIFVQHKHLADEMFDKGYYYVIARYRLWQLWANPAPYRPLIDSLVNERDAQLTAAVAARGRKLYETPFYTLWRLDPVTGNATGSANPSGAAAKDEAHLAKVDGHGERGTP
ncbi:MAG TPA: glycosyltransferase family 39 protein [Gemmatimonadaceae bacterium]|nr:glycosyltransferase family 39 protein [Gemmatimonadaceae bacterium]